jgi:Domain of unknown function (DUF4349)
MPRKLSFILIAVLSLAGCGPRNGESRREAEILLGRNVAAPAPVMMPDIAANRGQIFSYSHTLSLAMSHDAVKTRADRARESCLRDVSLHCKLLTANVADDDGTASAHLEVALPHDKLAAYEDGLLKPVAPDKGGVDVRSRSTQAQSVENEKNDTDKKVAQLTKYRDGLAELAKRPNLSVDDFIKVQGELAKTEADLGDALGEKRDIGDRIARESLMVDLAQRTEPVAAVSPLGQVWSEAGDLFAGSTADVLRFAIQIVPWLPVGAILFFLLRWVFRIARRRPTIAKSAEANNGG